MRWTKWLPGLFGCRTATTPRPDPGWEVSEAGLTALGRTVDPHSGHTFDELEARVAPIFNYLAGDSDGPLVFPPTYPRIVISVTRSGRLLTDPAVTRHFMEVTAYGSRTIEADIRMAGYSVRIAIMPVYDEPRPDRLMIVDAKGDNARTFPLSD